MGPEEFPWLPEGFRKTIEAAAVATCHGMDLSDPEKVARAHLIGGYLLCLQDLEAAERGEHAATDMLEQIMRARKRHKMGA